MKNSLKIAIFYIVLIGILIIATASLWDNIPEEKLVFSQVVEMFRNEQVRQFEVDEENTLTMIVRQTTNDGVASEAIVTYQLRDLDLFLNELGDLIRTQHDAGIIDAYDYPPPYEIPWWVSLVPYAIVIILMIVM